MSKRSVVLALCCVLYVLSFFHRNSPAIIANDLMDSFEFTPATLGALSGSTMLAYGLMQMPSGLLADALGGRRTIIALSLLAGLAGLGFALSPNRTAAMAARFTLGAGIAVTVPAFSLLALWFSPQSYGRAVSVLTACGGLGGLLAAPPLAALSGVCGWRPAIAFFSGLTLLAVVLFALVVSDAPRPQNFSSHNKPRTPKNTSAGTALRTKPFHAKEHAAPRSQSREALNNVFTVLRTRAFWPLCLWQMTMVGTYFMLAGLWWAPYLMDAAGCSRAQAAAILTMSSLVLLVGQPCAAWLSDTVLRARCPLLRAGTALCLPAAAAMAFFAGHMPFPVLIVLTFAFCVGMSAPSPLIFAMIKEIFPPRLTGTALGCVNMLYPLWAAVLQSLFGMLLQWRLAATGDAAAAYACACLLVAANVAVALLMTLLMRETYPDCAPSTSSLHAACRHP